MVRPAQRNGTVPAAMRPRSAGKQAQLMGWPVFALTTQTRDLVTIDPQAGTITIHPDTLYWVKSNFSATTELANEKAEAVRTMQVVMVDVGRHAPARKQPARPKPVLQQPSGIKALCVDLQALVADMACCVDPTPDQTREFAMRYGRMRDAMAGLRSAFSEAEGNFETAQTLLVAQMSD